VSVV